MRYFWSVIGGALIVGLFFLWINAREDLRDCAEKRDDNEVKASRCRDNLETTKRELHSALQKTPLRKLFGSGEFDLYKPFDVPKDGSESVDLGGVMRFTVPGFKTIDGALHILMEVWSTLWPNKTTEGTTIQWHMPLVVGCKSYVRTSAFDLMFVVEDDSANSVRIGSFVSEGTGKGESKIDIPGIATCPPAHS